jgi:uncharacterized membrane protein
MNSLLDKPARALMAGVAATGLVLAAWLLTATSDALGLVSVLLRFVHIVAAMAWIGLVFFVNFVQLEALEAADEASRGAILKWIAPRVAAGIRHTSHLTVLSGVLLLIATGYLFGEWIFSSAVYAAPARTLVLAAGVAGALLMWGFVNLVIWPSLRIVLGQTPGDAPAQALARRTVKRYARLNLVLALPVTFLMVAAAHLA